MCVTNILKKVLLFTARVTVTNTKLAMLWGIALWYIQVHF
jgi:hypothetical protein